MTNKNLFIIIIVLSIFITSALYAACPYNDRQLLYRTSIANGKKGHADLAKVFDNFKMTKDFEKALEAKGKEKEAERNIMIDELKRMKNEAPMLSASEREEKQVIVDRKIEELKAFDKKTRDWLVAARNEMLAKILKDIESEVGLFAEAEGYEYIVNTKFGKDGKDLTSQIIQILNEKYEKNKSQRIVKNTPMESSPVKEASPDISKNKGDDTISQLERLASLKEKGILTEEEFQNQKKKIISH